MGKGPEQTFFLRRHTNGQQVREKVLSIPEDQENHLPPLGVAVIKKTKDRTCWWECDWCSHREKQDRGPPGSKLELPQDPAAALLDAYLKEVKSLTCQGICAPTFSVALLTTALTWR